MHARTLAVAALTLWAATQGGTSTASAAFISYSGVYTYTGPDIIGTPGGGIPRVVLRAGGPIGISVGYDLASFAAEEVAPGVFNFRLGNGFSASVGNGIIGATRQFGSTSTLRIVLDADGVGGSMQFRAFGGIPMENVEIVFNDPDGLVIRSLTPPSDLSGLALLGGSYYGRPFRYFPEFGGSFSPAVVPEPGSVVLLGLGGVAGVGAWARKRRRERVAV